MKEFEMVEKDNSKRIKQQTHGDRIRTVRAKEGLTQAQLAEFLEMGNDTLSRIENGDSLLKIDKAISLHLEYGYSLNWIYGISEIEKDNNEPYYVDIRDIVQIKNGHVNISIKKYLFDLLVHINSSPTVKEAEIDEEMVALSKGIGKQRRQLAYFHNKNEIRCVCIDTNQFEIKNIDTKRTRIKVKA